MLVPLNFHYRMRSTRMPARKCAPMKLQNFLWEIKIMGITCARTPSQNESRAHTMRGAIGARENRYRFQLRNLITFNSAKFI